MYHHSSRSYNSSFSNLNPWMNECFSSNPYMIPYNNGFCHERKSRLMVVMSSGAEVGTLGNHGTTTD